MTRRDYILISDAIREAVDTIEKKPIHIGQKVLQLETAERVTESIANALYEANARFDRQRFLDASGFKVTE